MHTGRPILRVETDPGRRGGRLWFFPALRGARVCAQSGSIDDAPAASDADHLLVSHDLSNLETTIKWVQSNPAESNAIAWRAASRAPTRATILAYWQHLLRLISGAAQYAVPKSEVLGSVALYGIFDPVYADLQ